VPKVVQLSVLGHLAPHKNVTPASTSLVTV
jgi:hypothetical protein